MFIVKIVNKSLILPKLTFYNYFNCLSHSIKLLKFVKKETFSFFISWLFILIFLNSYKLKTKINYFIKYIFVSAYQNQKLINYVLNINQLKTNTLINLNDIKGNPKIFYSAGMLNLQKKQKIRQPKAAITMLRQLISKSKNLKQKPAVLHFNNMFLNYRSYIFKKLKQKIFIKLIVNYSNTAHNGCRLKKKKRVKIRTKTKKLKEWLSGLKWQTVNLLSNVLS